MELEKQPKRLAIIGGGYIGLEFAGMFNSFGTHINDFRPTYQIVRARRS